MSSPAFAAPAALAATARAPVSRCSFVSRRAGAAAAQAPRRAVVMQTRDPRIGVSEYQDEGGDDDCGDGFMGEANFSESMGVEMPKDLMQHEVDDLFGSKSRDELVDKLKIINRRKKDIMDDRRRGMGMDNVGNYLDAL